ncbi:MAG: hypothetical protein JRG94_14985 [Deltaproteobacteria bacterium]|nr:hypothetical protein [Deltaproteobacteria bacterium]
MSNLYYESDADVTLLKDLSIAVVGYGNQGRSWALNLRDSGFVPRVCVRADESRDLAQREGFETGELADASQADVVCILIPDDAIPKLPLERRDTGLTIVASGYSLAFDRFKPAGDTSMVAPRMLGPEVRLCYEEGVGFITAVGVQEDRTGRALAHTLAIASAIGGLRQGRHDTKAGGRARPRGRAGALARAHTRESGLRADDALPGHLGRSDHDRTGALG